MAGSLAARLFGTPHGCLHRLRAAHTRDSPRLSRLGQASMCIFNEAPMTQVAFRHDTC